MPHRRSVIAGLLAAPLLAALPGSFFAALAQDDAADTVPSSEGDITIHPVSHASLVLEWNGHVLYVDPVGGAALYEGLPAATGILVTHEHPDHFDAATLQALPEVAIMTTQTVADALPEELKARALPVANGGRGELDGVIVAAVPAYNTTPDRQNFHPQGIGNGYVLTFGDKKVYVAGDTEDTPEMRALTEIDVAFLPMNLPYTMDETQAADAVKAFRPGIVYPYHYQGSDTQKFADLVGDAAEVRLRDWYQGE